MKTGGVERVFRPPVSLQSWENTHTNGKSSRGDSRRKLCCISLSDVLSSLDGGVDIRERNGCLTDRGIWTLSIQKCRHAVLPPLRQKQQVLQPVSIHKMHYKREHTLVYTCRKHDEFSVTLFIQKNGS